MAQSGHGAKPLHRHDALIAAMLTSVSIEQAADKAGVPISTARRWLKLPEVQSDYRDARRQIVDHAVVSLQRSANAAVTTILRNLNAPAPEAVQLRAAELVMKYAIDAIELNDLAARVEELENQLKITPIGGPRRVA